VPLQAGAATLRATIAATAVSCALGACGDPPGAASRNCRRYATRLNENGSVWECEFVPATLRCLISVSRLRSFSYASVADFVREAGVPNRILAQERRSASGGPFLISFGGTSTSYRYDPDGRLIERVRTGTAFTGTTLLESVRYTRWDVSGRPVAGEITTRGQVEPLSVTYDDVRRTARASNGERTVRDVHGNIVEEVEFSAALGGQPREFVVEAMAEVCE
jgi:hypothetical protein